MTKNDVKWGEYYLYMNNRLCTIFQTVTNEKSLVTLDIKIVPNPPDNKPNTVVIHNVLPKDLQHLGTNLKSIRALYD